MSDSALAFEQLRLADGRWESALRASALAPSDPGFAGRIRAIAAAAEQEAAAFRTADAAGLAWPPLPDAREMNLSYELRRGGTRPGPVELWHRFEAAVFELGAALEGVALSAIVRGDIRPQARAIVCDDEQDRPSFGESTGTPPEKNRHHPACR